MFLPGYLLPFWLLLWSNTGQAASPLPINQTLAGIPLGHHVSIHLDADRRDSAETIRSGDVPFREVSENAINIGLSRAIAWLRLDVINPGADTVEWYLDVGEALISDIRLYTLDAEGHLTERRSGFEQPFAGRDVAIGRPVFKLRENPHSTHTYWLRAEPFSAHRFPLKAWGHDEWAQALHHEGIGHGVWYGALLMMFCYNLVLALKLRERTYGWFAVHVAMAALAQASYSGKFVPWLSGAYSDLIMVVNFVFFAMKGLSGMEMTRHFLDLPHRAPLQNRICRWLTGSYGLIVLLTVLPGVLVRWIGPAINLLSLPTSLFIIYVSVHAMYRGYKSARYFVLAWLGSTLGILIFALRNLAIIDINPFTTFAYSASMLAGLVLFSMALADRIKAWQDEREAAQSALLEERRQAERILEQRVVERTESLHRQKQRADDANQLKDRYVALVAHDLRSPLSSLKQVLARLSDLSTPLPVEEQPTLQRMDATVSGLLTLIDQILDLERLKTGRVSLQIQSFDLHALVNEQIERVEEEARRRGICLANEIPTPHQLQGDRLLIGEVMANLLINAIRFCRRDDRIFVRVAGEGSGSIEIADSGPGLPAAWADIPPGQFGWMKPQNPSMPPTHGTGLGLALCEAIITAHGGIFMAGTSLEGGASFRMNLPTHQSTGLLVGGSENGRILLRRCLAETWPELVIEECEDAASAQARLVSHFAGIIICDVNLPDMDGLELVRRLRQQDRFDRTPVLLTDTLADEAVEDMERKVGSVGGDAFVNRPLTARHWLEICHELSQIYPVFPVMTTQATDT